ECRSGGANGDYTLVFSFVNTLNAVSSITATATTSSGTQTLPTPAGTIGTDTHEYIVNLSGVPNASHVNVTLNGVTDSANLTGDISVQMDVLVGDTTADGSVNSADISQTKSQSGHAVSSSNFRQDVSADGALNSADISLVKSKSG